MQVLLLLLSAVGFCWGQYNPNTLSKRTSIVHLFEWRWADIALECERYLAPNGFGGVQVSPPNENIVVTNPNRPWWERYQPVSYKLCTRSGNEDEFRDMVTRCNNVGVHIYVDAVVNHMCGAAGGSGTHSTCGSYFNAGNRDFPAVPYSGWDFNDGKCHSGSGEIENYGDIYQVRDCRLVSLLDLALEKDYVRSKVAEYMNHLIDIGVAGFRLDAAKHMWPGDIRAFLDKLKDLNTKWFPEGTKPFIYQEVIDLGGEPIKGSEYFGNGRVTEFKYGAKLGTVIRKWNGEKMAYLKNWGEGWEWINCICLFSHRNMSVYLQTGLPAGTYCDVISGQKENNKCTGKQVLFATLPYNMSTMMMKKATVSSRETPGLSDNSQNPVLWSALLTMVVFKKY
ncbi:pancreatic alpha-amylase-like [Empidonax traillii]|uniref:pancreatic alpha-amylase-like n=1 Tax=Empidonax traillii TaxID=164674 RepID=UPI000FFD28C9|nr:pancreatic alpha-amylase-like [Empidonax traillii]